MRAGCMQPIACESSNKKLETEFFGILVFFKLRVIKNFLQFWASRIMISKNKNYFRFFVGVKPDPCIAYFLVEFQKSQFIRLIKLTFHRSQCFGVPFLIRDERIHIFRCLSIPAALSRAVSPYFISIKTATHLLPFLRSLANQRIAIISKRPRASVASISAMKYSVSLDIDDSYFREPLTAEIPAQPYHERKNTHPLCSFALQKIQPSFACPLGL